MVDCEGQAAKAAEEALAHPRASTEAGDAKAAWAGAWATIWVETQEPKERAYATGGWVSGTTAKGEQVEASLAEQLTWLQAGAIPQ